MAAERQHSVNSGFTLIEMIVVIVIIGILASLGGRLIVGPVTGYIDLSRRTRLVDQAEMALRRMQRDIRQALPNSIRISAGNQSLELLHTVDGGRYRRYQDPGPGGDDILDFSTTDSSFDVLGNLRGIPDGLNLVIYNISSSGLSGNAYAAIPDNRTLVAAGSTLTHINLVAPFQFAHSSPYQRFFLLDQAITYRCEAGVLNRYAGYAIGSVPVAGSAALVTNGVSSCTFGFDPGASQRAGLATITISLTEAGETINLLHQVHVVNAP